MNASAFSVFAENNQWSVLWPEISLALIALILLLLDCFLPKDKRSFIPGLAVFLQGGLFLAVSVFFIESRGMDAFYAFNGLIYMSSFGSLLRAFFLLSSLLVSYLALVYFKKQPLPRTEFFHVMLIVTAAMMLLVQSAHFVMFFVALETVTIGFYVLVAYCRTSAFSLEAGLKYLILGALSSALLLFGIVLLYGVAGNPELPAFTQDSMSFLSLQTFIENNAHNALVQLGVLLVISGVAFKIGAVPFQIWIPDVYQGAPTPVTAFLAVASKTAGFMVLLNLIQGPFASMEYLLKPLLSAVAVVTILFGNMAALSQQNLKRLMGLSGVAHAGYLLVGVVAAFHVHWAPLAVLFYLITYLLGSFAVFGVMAHVAGEQDEAQELSDYQDLAQRNTTLASVLTMGLGSLAGIPPLVGFISKVLLFIAAFRAELYTLLGVSILGVVISIYYYFGWVREAFFRSWHAPQEAPVAAIPLSGVHVFILGLLAMLTLLLGLFQNVLGWALF